MSIEQELIEAGDRLFNKRGNLLAFWDELAANFDPVRANFQGQQTLGEDYASHLTTSYPLLVQRDLSDSISSMLRPVGEEWATMYVENLEDWDGKRWLEWATKVQRRAMYDRVAQFVPAAKEGDRDWTLFGQAVVSVQAAPSGRHLVYRSWHLRDCAWSDDITGAVECFHRKWDNPTAMELARQFGENKLHQKVRDQLAPGKDPYCEVKCRHIVMPSDMWRGEQKFRTPLVSIYVDVDNQHIMQMVGVRLNDYVVPRWQRIKGTPYAVSPAAVCALPEARLLQAMTYTLLEAGEKAVRPPLIATREAIRGDVNVDAGALTWVEASYDERMGDVLRPLNIDKGGLPLGLELQQRSEMFLRSAFYLDRLTMPQKTAEMREEEVHFRVAEYLRNSLPIIEPAEVEYNGGLCERTFEVLALNGAFGSPDTWPDSVRGADIEFKFASPLRDAKDKHKGATFIEASQIVSAAAALDPSAAGVVNAAEALRDTLAGIGVPTAWTNSREMVEAMKKAQAQQAAQEQMLASMQQAAAINKDLAAAA